MNAGEIALTRTPNGARSLAALLTRPTTAAFVAEYTGMFGAPVTPAIEAVHTIAPPPPADTIASDTAASTATTPKTFTSMIERASVSE